MGRLVSVILFVPRVIFAVVSITVLLGFGAIAWGFGCEVRPLKRPEDNEALTQDAESSDPEKNNDDEIRRWGDDLSPEHRLAIADKCFQDQQAEVGVLIDDPIHVWAEKREAKRRAAAQRN